MSRPGQHSCAAQRVVNSLQLPGERASTLKPALRPRIAILLNYLVVVLKLRAGARLRLLSAR